MFLEVQKRQEFWYFFRDLNQQIFEVSLISYLVFFLLDDLFDKIISHYFNLNILLVALIVSGVILNLFGLPKKEEEIKSPKLTDYIFILVLGLIGGAIIFYKIDLIFWLRLTISILSGLIIILLSILLINEEQNEL